MTPFGRMPLLAAWGPTPVKQEEEGQRGGDRGLHSRGDGRCGRIRHVLWKFDPLDLLTKGMPHRMSGEESGWSLRVPPEQRESEIASS